MNRVRSSSAGYTIVETMIFLAVSGVLFFSAMLLVNGQQNKTQFSTAVREFDSKLVSVIGNVSSGYYNNAGNIRCDLSGGLPNPFASPTEPGQSGDCIYLGQFIEIVSPTSMTFTSYAGLRVNSSGDDVQNLAEAMPTPIIDSTENFEFLDGIEVKMAVITNAELLVAVDTLGIFSSFAQSDSGGLVSGNNSVDVIAKNGPATVATNPPKGVKICLSDGKQVGIILLNNGSTNVSIGRISVSNPDPCRP